MDMLADKSPEDQAAALQGMSQEELDALSSNLDQVESNGIPDAPADKADVSAPIEEKKQPAPPKATDADFQAAAAEIKPDEKISENLAQAAEQVTSESELDQLQGGLDAASFDELKRQAIAAAKAQKAQEINTQIEDHQKKHFGDKADVPEPTGDSKVDAMQTDIANFEAQEKREAGAKQTAEKRQALKQEALDQGYTEEQANLYVEQEMQEEQAAAPAEAGQAAAGG